MSGTNTRDQRQYKRFKIPEAIVVTPDTIGSLVDISTGGLAFKCCQDTDLPTKCTLDIIVAGSNLHLKQFPVELVWKKKEEKSSFLSRPGEEIGVKFDDLHTASKAMLDYFFFETYQSGDQE